MKLTKRLQIGKNSYSFSFEGADLFECLMESQKVSLWDIHSCGKCGKENLNLKARITKEGGYKYIDVCCTNPECRAKVTLGQSKNENAYYYRKDKETGKLAWETYESKDNTAKVVWED